MKPIVLIILIIGTITISSYSFVIKPPKDDGNISNFEAGLFGIFNVLNKESKINFISTEPKVQQLLEARYVLFPIGLYFKNDFQFDTTLIIIPLNDTTIQIPNIILWKNKDAHFQYYLVTK